MISHSFFIILVLVVIWSLIWKGLALWKSARRDDLWWFIAIIVINTCGILEIIYIFFIAGGSDQKKNELGSELEEKD